MVFHSFFDLYFGVISVLLVAMVEFTATAYVCVGVFVLIVAVRILFVFVLLVVLNRWSLLVFVLIVFVQGRS
jgi:hypothetical protein